jgi:hypothetical protein
VGGTLLKKDDFFSKMTSSSENPPFCIFEKKYFLQKLDNKKTLRLQSRFLKSVKNWNFEIKITKIQVSDAIFNTSAILSNFKIPSWLIGQMTNYQQIRIQKCFLKNPLDGVSVEFWFRKNVPDAILIFGRHFIFFSNLLFFRNI